MKRKIGEEITSMYHLWYPFRWGLRTRRFLKRVASTYGSGLVYKVRRPLAVFLSALLDESHQENFTGTFHHKVMTGEWK